MSLHTAEDLAFRRDLGVRLRRARKQARLTQASVAKATGLHRSALSLAERGIRKIDALELSLFAQLYGCSMDALAGREAWGGVRSDSPAARLEVPVAI